MRKSILILVFLVAGCTGSYDPSAPLSRQLAGQTFAGRESILRLDCLNEAERITSFITATEPRGLTRRFDSPEMHKMKDMCENMFASAGQPARQEKLALECSKRLNVIARHPRTQAVEDGLSRMHSICEAMTGFEIDSNP